MTGPGGEGTPVCLVLARCPLPGATRPLTANGHGKDHILPITWPSAGLHHKLSNYLPSAVPTSQVFLCW